MPCNFLSIAIIAAGGSRSLHRPHDEAGKGPVSLRLHGAPCDDGKHGPHLRGGHPHRCEENRPAEIREGDVISFYSLDPALDGAVNTHRVVSVEKEGDGYIYQTKGDANNVADAYDVQSEYLVGKVIWSSLILGKISRLAANPLIFIPVILLPLSVILLTNLIHTVRLAKKITREEEEAAVREAVEELRKRKNQEKPLE